MSSMETMVIDHDVEVSGIEMNGGQMIRSGLGFQMDELRVVSY